MVAIFGPYLSLVIFVLMFWCEFRAMFVVFDDIFMIYVLCFDGLQLFIIFWSLFTLASLLVRVRLCSFGEIPCGGADRIVGYN